MLPVEYLPELNVDDNEDIRADNITENKSPLCGVSNLGQFFDRLGAALESTLVESQIVETPNFNPLGRIRITSVG